MTRTLWRRSSKGKDLTLTRSIKPYVCVGAVTYLMPAEQIQKPSGVSNLQLFSSLGTGETAQNQTERFTRNQVAACSTGAVTRTANGKRPELSSQTIVLAFR